MKFSDDTFLSETQHGSCESISGYRLETLIDSSPRGDIYRAVQIESGISCLITIRKADVERSERFLSNAELAATLFNPGIADVYESGSLENGNVFVVAEDADGRSLRELLDSDGVPQLLDTVEIIRQAAEALHSLHLKGLTHRAIRPENILLANDEDGQTLVRLQHLDFGGLAEHSTICNKFLIESALDSIRYFAPEQSSGEGATVRTDIYSLGIVFYEMLTGSPPFDSSKANALIGMHRNQPPPDVRIDNFDLRMLVTHALMESLQKRPDARQSTADLLARQLRHIEQLATHVSTPAAILDAPLTSTKPLPRKVFVAPDIDILAGIVENTHAPVVESAPVLFQEPEPANIEPSLEQAVCLSLTAKTAVPAVQKQRTKIEWQPIDDDIPTLEDVMDTLAGDQEERAEPAYVNIVEPHVYLSSPPDNVAVQIERTKVEWEPFDDDIPTIEDVRETLANEQEQAVGLEASTNEESPVVHNVSVPNSTDWLPYEPVVARQVVAAVIEAPFFREQMVETPVVEPEPEEITIVTAPRRIKVDLERPIPAMPAFQTYEKFSPRRSNEINFYPTLLGRSNTVATLETRENDGIFSSFNEPKHRLFISGRLMAVGGGLVLLIGFFLFGSDSVGSLTSSATRDESATATKTEPISIPTDKQSIVSKTALVEAPIEKRKSSKLHNELAKGKDESEPKSVSIKPGVVAAAEKPKQPVQNKTRPPLLPTTLVISAEKGKVKMNTEPTKKSAGATRPRIVKEP